MAGVPQKTLNWLWDVLRREYRDPQRTYSDLAQTLALYPAFAPRTDVYTSEQGAPALLVHLNGILPVTFRGSTYRFPIAIWVLHAYPYESPIAYVAPTDDMVIRPGQHVSAADGRIYHPYLARWRDSWDRSNIVEFLRLLAEVFAREPPVMAKQQMPPQQAQQRQTAAPPPRPPAPGEERRFSGQQSHSSIPMPPLPPPKQSFQANGSEMNSATGTASPKLGRYDAPPPLPHEMPRQRRPPSADIQSPDQYATQQRLPLRQKSLQQPEVPLQAGMPAPNYQSPPAPPQQSGHAPYMMQQAHSQGPNAMNQPHHHHHRQSHHTPEPQNMGYSTSLRDHVPPTHPYPSQGRQHPPQSYVSTPVQPQIPPNHYQPPQDLLDDSPFDVSLPKSDANLPTPAIPPNPEKAAVLGTLSSSILQILHSQVQQSRLALPALQSQNAALATAQQQLQYEISHLQGLQTQISQNITSLNQTMASADRTIGSAKQDSSSKNKIPGIDEMIIPPTVVARQLYDAVAEQRGYEAAIFALTEGFVRGRIGSEMWGRKTRECAREEFRRKWLVKRVGKGMGLDLGEM